KNVPHTEIYLYSLMRGIGNTAWAIPLFGFYFVFYPVLRAWKPAEFRRAFAACVWIALAFQLIAISVISWRDAIFQRAFASLDGSDPWLASRIGMNQKGYLLFCLLYFIVGIVGVFLIRWVGASETTGMHIISLSGLALTQLLFYFASYNAVELNLRFP